MKLFFAAGLSCLLCCAPVFAADSYWTNTAGGEFSSAANWAGGVPGPGDNARFTNAGSYQVIWTAPAANADAFFSAGTVTQAIGTASWLLTNSYVAGQSTATVGIDHLSGMLLVTNSDQSALMTIGQGNTESYYTLNGGSIIADNLVASNTVGSLNASFYFNAGTLTTRRSHFRLKSSDFNIGSTAGQSAVWNISGGTNTIAYTTSQSTTLGRFAGNAASVTVTGMETLFTNGGTLRVGYIAPGNQLTISNGARVDTAGIIAGETATAGNNSIVVTGSNSWLNATGFTVGYESGQNQLTLSDGARLNSSNGTLGSRPASGGNIGLVTGNALWQMPGTLFVGESGGTNALTISGGARLFANHGYVGQNSHSNSVLLTGNESSWHSTNEFYVGQYGAFNRITISAGARLTNNVAIIGGQNVGNVLSPSNNLAELTGAGSVWHVGSTLAVGFPGRNNRLLINDGARLSCGTILAGSGNVSLAGGASNNVVIISGAGTYVTNTGGINIGSFGPSNHFAITAGAEVNTGDSGIGNSSSNNVAIVTDPGTIFSNRNSLTLGAGGASNFLLVTNGAFLFSRTGTIGSGGAAGSNNFALVTDPGTTWSNQVFVLGQAAANRLVVSNGARLLASQEFRAGNVASNSLAIFTGTGTVLETPEAYCGTTGSDHWMIVTNGAFVRTTFRGYAGHFGTNCTVIVTGPGSIWTNTSAFYVGNYGPGNLLLVTNGGVVHGGLLYAGYNTDASNNTVVVTGPGSLFSGQGSYIGYNGSHNRVTVTNQAQMLGIGTLGFYSHSNSVLVTGSNTYATTISASIGFNGSANTLVISNGARVVSYGLGTWINSSSSASNNSVIVTGPGSEWIVTNALNVGSGSSQNAMLLVSNFARLVATNLNVANSGNNHRLTVAAGATVVCTNMFVSENTGESNNIAEINNGFVYVTNSARMSLLGITGRLILNGGTLEADRLSLFAGATSSLDVNYGVVTLRNTDVQNNKAVIFGDGVNYARLNLIASNGFYGFSGLRLASNAALYAQGTLSGAFTNQGLLSVNQPGLAGRLSTSDIRLQDSSVLHLHIGGTSQGTNYDFIAAANVTFGGALRVSLINGFVPHATNVFTVMTSISRTGSFTNVASGTRLNTTDRLGSFLVNYSGSSMTLSQYQSNDTNGDGIDDAWAQTYFGTNFLADGTGPTQKHGDFDGDGVSNYHEFLAGTDPTDANSAFKIVSVMSDGAGITTLQFKPAPNRTHLLQYSTDLVSWTDLPAAQFSSPSPDVRQWTDDSTLTGLFGGTRYYRLRLE